MRRNKIFLSIFLLTFLIFFLWGLISWDIYRWETFKDETGSTVGYFKWKFVIDSK